jgi:hypothetical protein
MSEYDSIDAALGAESPQPIVKAEPQLPVKVDALPLTDDKLEKDLKLDYDTVRSNLKDLVQAGQEALNGVIAVAQEGDSPRAYEVVAQMIKTLSETNRDLLDIHNKIKTIRKVENNTNNVTNTTNSIYVGSTKELQDIINASRSTTKAFANRPDVLERIQDDKQNVE